MCAYGRPRTRKVKVQRLEERHINKFPSFPRRSQRNQDRCMYSDGNICDTGCYGIYIWVRLFSFDENWSTSVNKCGLWLFFSSLGSSLLYPTVVSRERIICKEVCLFYWTLWLWGPFWVVKQLEAVFEKLISICLLRRLAHQCSKNFTYRVCHVILDLKRTHSLPWWIKDKLGRILPWPLSVLEISRTVHYCKRDVLASELSCLRLRGINITPALTHQWERTYVTRYLLF